jgi:hypothetical protein
MAILKLEDGIIIKNLPNITSGNKGNKNAAVAAVAASGKYNVTKFFSCASNNIDTSSEILFNSGSIHLQI